MSRHAGHNLSTMNAQCDKLVIMARGLGTRMRRNDHSAQLDDRQAAMADTGVKALIPIKRPFLDYVLTAAADAGFRRVCLVLAPEHDLVRDYYGRQLSPRRLEFSFAVQEEPRGTADAVLAAEPFAGEDEFVVLNSDNYYPSAALQGIRQTTGCAVALFDWQSMIDGSNIPRQRLRQFSVAKLDAAGLLERILEKPDDATWHALPRPLWIGMNCWRFRPSIFRACRSIGLSPRGELELTDAVQHAIDVLGERFHAVLVHAPVLDLSSRQDVAPIAARLADLEVDL